MIREHFANRTTAPQPQAVIAGIVWAIALLCLHDGSQPKWAWGMVAMATLLTGYVGVQFWLYHRVGKAR